jgi:hypothetical protein
MNMAHSHDDTHSRHVDVVERHGPGAGALVALAAIIIFAIVAFAVLYSRPWDDDGAADNSPGITDVVPEGDDVAPGGDVPGTDDGSGGGAAPDGGEQPAQ